MQSTPVFVGSGFVASYLEGGGSFWIPLQYLLGLHAHGVEAYWLEVFYASDDAASDRNRIQTFFERAKRLGAGERVVILYLFGGHDTDDAQLITANPLAGVDLRSAMRAGVLLNLNNHIPRAHRTGFARTVLYDIDPGMLQLWSKQADMGVGDHDLYITIGQSIGEAGCSVPECGVSWHRIWPTVHLPAWPMQDGVGARYTTVTHWWNGNRGYDLIDGQLYEHNKRTSFLEYIDMPGRTGLELELAAYVTPGEIEDRQALKQHGWRLVEPRHVAGTANAFRTYVQASRGEFSCAKPSVLKASPGWISDRTICYLASGRPCVVQDAGARRHLPNTLGLQSFSTQEEAAEALRAAERDHERARREARMLAEEFFSTDVVIPKIIDLVGIERAAASRYRVWRTANDRSSAAADKQPPVTNHAGVQQCHVADRGLVADHALDMFAGFERDMHDRPVLDIGAGADADRRIIAADDAVEPDIRARPDLDIADDDRPRRDESAWIDPRQDVAVRQDHRPHLAPPLSRTARLSQLCMVTKRFSRE